MDTKLVKNIQQYIELVYSEKSDLNRIEDLDARKNEACQMLKIDAKSEFMQSVMRMKDEKINALIFDYLSKQNSNEFMLLLSDEHLLCEIVRRQLEPLEESPDKDRVLKDLDLKTKMSEKAGELLDRIYQRRIKIFKGEQEQEMAEAKIRIMTPEQRLKSKKSA